MLRILFAKSLFRYINRYCDNIMVILPYLYPWNFDKCDYMYALNRLLDYFSKLRNVILLLTSINCRKSTMIDNVTNRVDFFLFKGIITLFFFSTLTLNVVF